MTPARHLPALAAALAVAIPMLVAPAATVAKPKDTVPACSKAAPQAQLVLVDKNKHCAPAQPPPPPPPPPPEEPPPPPCNEAAPSQILTASPAGPYTVTKVAANSLAVMHPAGGLNAATELDVEVGGTGYGFTKGSVVPWFTLPWGEFEVRIENWEHFAGKAITAVQFYQYPYPGPLFGGWQQLERPIVMGVPAADGC